jgi:hypothetical protein
MIATNNLTIVVTLTPATRCPVLSIYRDGDRKRPIKPDQIQLSTRCARGDSISESYLLLIEELVEIPVRAILSCHDSIVGDEEHVSDPYPPSKN